MLSPSHHRHFPEAFDSGILGSLDRQHVGENLVRSQSAAPSFDGGLSMGPPPGLAQRETPLVSNRSSNGPASLLAPDSYLESSLDRSYILQLGQRRPASTGVIDGSQTSSSSVLSSLGFGTGIGAVRPAAKTLMDLIQEDFPPESPGFGTGDFYGSSFQRESAYALDRPRTTSPLSSQYNSLRPDQYIHSERDGGELLASLESLRLEVGNESLLSFRNGSAVSLVCMSWFKSRLLLFAIVPYHFISRRNEQDRRCNTRQARGTEHKEMALASTLRWLRTLPRVYPCNFARTSTNTVPNLMFTVNSRTANT
jgi:hypothetical protein